MITFLVMRVFYLVEAAVWILMRYPVITAGRRYALVMLGLLVVVAVESAALGSRMYRCRSVLVGRRPVVTDLTVVTIALVVVSDHVMAPDLRGPWGCGIYNVALTSAVLVGTQMTDRRTAIRCGILLVSGFWALGAVPFLAPLPAVALTGLDASWLLTYFVIAAVICVVGRQLGDTADAVRDRLAELERERSRARVQAFLPFLDPGSGSGSGEPAAVRRRHRLHRAMRAFVDGVQSPPPSRFERQSLREDIERKIVFAGVGLRGACLLVVTMAAVAQGLNSSWPAPHALAGLGVVAVESLVVGVWTHRRGRLTGARGPVAIDLLTAMAALGILLDPLASVSTSVWNLRVGTVAASASIILGLAARSPLRVAAGSLALSLVHVLVVAVPAWGRSTVLAPTVAYASCGYWTCAVVAWLFARRIRHLASEADTARQRIVELERQRSRAVVHDLLPFLRTAAEPPPPGLVPAAVTRQVRAKYRQVKAFAEGADVDGDLTSRVESLFDLHPRVDIRPRLDLPPGLCLPTEVAARVERAVDTALANAEQNAPGATVRVTATASGGSIVLTVRDDGPGFDPDRTPPGYGIAHILGSQLAEVGARGTVSSRLGEGTVVTVTVPRSCS